jgi:DNA-directed RNA polymerase specialized sigma24 family protein
MVVTLRYTEDFSYEEIAQTLNVPLNTVRTQLRRAKHILKIKLEKDFVPTHKPNDFVHTRTVEGGF